jgi:MoxR-like ATPase
MLIVGEPGSGKTMAAYTLIEYLDNAEGDDRVPLLEAVVNSIRNGLGMQETEIVSESSRPWKPHLYTIFAQVLNTL